MPDEAATVDPAQDYLRSRGLMPYKDITDLENLSLTKGKEISDKAISEIQANREQRQKLLSQPPPQVKPPNLQVPGKPPEEHLREPFEVYQNPLVLLATLGSLATRAPATAALNAGAAAMESQRNGDMHTYEVQRQKWKDEVERIKDINERELTKYEAIWRNAKMSVEDKMAKLAGLTADSRDTMAIAAFSQGNVDAFSKIIEARRKALDQIVEHQEQHELQRSQIEKNRAQTRQLTMAQEGGGPLNPDTARFMARQLINGNYAALTGLFQQKGAKAQIEAATRDVLMNEKGMTEEEAADYVTDRVAKFQGTKAYQTRAGQYGARVEVATNEVEQLVPQALETSKALPRGKFVPFNQLVQAYKRGTSDPAYNDFMAANFALLNAYTRAMNPTGTPHVNDRLEQHAIGLLSTATSPEAYEVQVRRLWKEVQASKKAVSETQKGLGKAKEFPGDTDEGWGELKVEGE